MSKIKQYFASTAVIAGLLLFGSTALALVAGSDHGKPQGPPEEIAQNVAAIQESHGQDLGDSDLASAQGDEASDGINHGHCVSYWAKQAKEAGLWGRAKGEFISSVAQNEAAVSAKVEDGGSPDGTCDFGAQLSAAVEGQGDRVNGKSGEDHGKSGESHGKSGENHGKSGESHGKSGEAPGKNR